MAYVYILASSKNGMLYIRVTSDLIKRVYQHRHNQAESFTSKYDVKYLVYYEQYESIVDAINREKQIKRWQRSWKISLIEKANPYWYDLWNRVTS